MSDTVDGGKRRRRSLIGGETKTGTREGALPSDSSPNSPDVAPPVAPAANAPLPPPATSVPETSGVSRRRSLVGRAVEPQPSIASMNPPSFEELSGTPIFVPPPPVVIGGIDDEFPDPLPRTEAENAALGVDPMARTYASGAEPLPYSPLPGKATSGETLVPAPSPLQTEADGFGGVPNAAIAAHVEIEPGSELQAYDPAHAPVPPRRPEEPAAAETTDIKPQFQPFQNTSTLNAARDGALVSVADSDTARFFDANLAAATAVGFGTDAPAPARSAAPANVALAGGVTLMIVGAAALALLVVILLIAFAMNGGSPQSSVITPALTPTASANTVQSPTPPPANLPRMAPVEETVATPEAAVEVAPEAAAPVAAAAKPAAPRSTSGTAAPKPASAPVKADKPADSPWGATDGKTTTTPPATTTDDKKKGGLFKKDK